MVPSDASSIASDPDVVKPELHDMLPNHVELCMLTDALAQRVKLIDTHLMEMVNACNMMIDQHNIQKTRIGKLEQQVRDMAQVVNAQGQYIKNINTRDKKRGVIQVDNRGIIDLGVYRGGLGEQEDSLDALSPSHVSDDPR